MYISTSIRQPIHTYIYPGQTWHTTEKRIYNDTINLTVAPVKKSSDINVSKTDTTITKTYAVPSLDTVNKNRSEHDSGEASTLTTVVTAFSISQIGGKICEYVYACTALHAAVSICIRTYSLG